MRFNLIVAGLHETVNNVCWV